MRIGKLCAATLLTLSAAACSEALGPKADAGLRNLGIVEWQGQGEPKVGNPGHTPGEWTSEPITAPATVQAGVPFEVIVRTIAPNGCWSAGDTTVEYAPGEVRITPYDVHSGAEACTELLGYLPHRVQVKVDAPGEVKLRVQGRRVVNGAVQEDPVVIVHRVVVQ